jgi:hypothetical protein
MDTVAAYREIIKKTMLRYAKLRPSHGDIRIDPVFDETNDRYVLMQVGWDRDRRVEGDLLYILLKDGKVCVEYDGMGHGISDDLISEGIPEDRIVFPFLRRDA